MVLLLNLLFGAVTLGFIYLGMRILKKDLSPEERLKKHLVLLGAYILVVFLMTNIQPTYFPKGVTGASLPSVSAPQVKGEIKSNLLESQTKEERSEDFKKAFNYKDKL